MFDIQNKQKKNGSIIPLLFKPALSTFKKNILAVWINVPHLKRKAVRKLNVGKTLSCTGTGHYLE
jgi:hypothetical protein